MAEDETEHLNDHSNPSNDGGSHEDEEFNIEDLLHLEDEDIAKLKFESTEDAFEFWRDYGLVHGFDVRKDDIGWAKDKVTMVSCQFLCSSEGKKREPKHDLQRRPKGDMRFDCKSKLRVKLDKSDSKWIVDCFEKVHSHPFIPKECRHYMKGNRRMSDAVKAAINFRRAAGMKTHEIVTLAVAEAGGYSRLGYTVKDAYNYVDNDRKEQISDGDAATALAYLQAKLSSDGQFVIELKKNDEGRLINLFWADSISVADYACFGDVLAFDATYKKNVYNMPLVIFSGVNHHFKSCIFGSAFVANEKEENYIWVLQALKSRLGGEEPKTIITDGDLSMRNAIQQLFPNATHRLCSWHIQQTICRRVKNAKAKFLPGWTHLLNADWDSPKFEAKWKSLVEDCSLQDNEWVAHLFSQRTEWGYTYLRSKFFAGLTTTSRCEGMNSQLTKYVANNHNLLEFFIHFDRWTRHMREKEVQADFESIYQARTITSNVLVSLQKSASNLFTKKVFSKFIDEVEKSANCIREDKQLAGNVHNYRLTMLGKEKIFEAKYTVDPFSIECSCDYYNYMGIPCCHMVFVLKEEKILELPEEWVRLRWSKKPKTLENLQQQDDSDVARLFTSRYGILQQSCLQLCLKGAKSNDGFKFARTEISTLCELLDKKNIGIAEMPDINRPKATQKLLNPLPVRYKGCGGGNKKKSGKSRQCSRCKKHGHYVSSCTEPCGNVMTETGTNVDADNGDESGGDDDAEGGGRRQKHCSRCGSTAHNVRRCPQSDEDRGDSDCEDADEGGDRRQKHCSKCGSITHNVRRCPEWNEPNDEDAGPSNHDEHQRKRPRTRSQRSSSKEI